MAHHQGDTYILKNVGDAAAAKAVELSGETLVGSGHITGGPDLGPREALSAATPTATLGALLTIC